MRCETPKELENALAETGYTFGYVPFVICDGEALCERCAHGLAQDWKEGTCEPREPRDVNAVLSDADTSISGLWCGSCSSVIVPQEV
jgi:hypothetical protein